MSTDLPKFIHDTRRIVDVNAAACALFRCEPCGLVDANMLDLLWEQDERGIRGLAALRLRVMRDNDVVLEHEMNYDFVRCDGTVFNGTVRSARRDDGLFETIVLWRFEVR